MSTLKAKNVDGRLIEVVDHETVHGGYRYGLYDNGSLVSQSNDLSFILREYDHRN